MTQMCEPPQASQPERKTSSPALQEWLNEVLGEAMTDRLPEVLECLEKEMCIDFPTLCDCWEEVKGNVPGVPRKLISDRLWQDEQAKVVFEPVVQGKLWLKAFFLSLPGIVFTSVLGAFKDLGVEAEGLEAEVMDTQGWYTSWGPLMVLYVIQIVIVTQTAPIIGYDMIENRSVNTSLKETMRTNMSNQAIVGTLLLTVAWAMLQSDPPVSDHEGLFVSQWYEGLLLVSTSQLIISVMTCAFTVLYVEPLDDLAALKFVGDNFIYFGEPLALMLLSFFNTCVATILWVFGSYGFGMGIVAVFVFAYCILRTVVIYLYLGFWSNPFLSTQEKKKRSSVKQIIMTATGKGKVDATGGHFQANGDASC